MDDIILNLISFIKMRDGINDKAKLCSETVDEFSLIRDGSVYYNKNLAIRFSSSNSKSFSNTVLSLSNLQKFDDKVFLVCLVTPLENYIYIANTTFLKKISHSSQELRENNIKGSFNGSDIMRDFENILNIPENIPRLYQIHAGVGFDINLVRLVEATNNISPSGFKFEPNNYQLNNIRNAPARAISFSTSKEAECLKKELDNKVNQYKNEILVAAMIENVNVRGRIIEYLIAGECETLKEEIISALSGIGSGIPKFKTENTLGDYSKDFHSYLTETDVKTKIMVLNSNPKGYNLDKLLRFLSEDKSIFMFYFVGIDPGKIINTTLISVFQEDLLKSTLLLKHWAGRNSRGVSQFEGKTIIDLIKFPRFNIDEGKSKEFLERLINI